MGVPFSGNEFFFTQKHQKYLKLFLIDMQKKINVPIPPVPHFEVQSQIYSARVTARVQTFYEKSPAVTPIFEQKTVNSVKITLFFGSKKSKGCPFVPIFHRKITSLMPIFCTKTSII